VIVAKVAWKPHKSPFMIVSVRAGTGSSTVFAGIMTTASITASSNEICKRDLIAVARITNTTGLLETHNAITDSRESSSV